MRDGLDTEDQLPCGFVAAVVLPVSLNLAILGRLSTTTRL
jgi:hypothetical protein